MVTVIISTLLIRSYTTYTLLTMISFSQCISIKLLSTFQSRNSRLCTRRRNKKSAPICELAYIARQTKTHTSFPDPLHSRQRRRQTRKQCSLLRRIARQFNVRRTRTQHVASPGRNKEIVFSRYKLALSLSPSRESDDESDRL